MGFDDGNAKTIKEGISYNGGYPGGSTAVGSGWSGNTQCHRCGATIALPRTLCDVCRTVPFENQYIGPIRLVTITIPEPKVGAHKYCCEDYLRGLEGVCLTGTKCYEVPMGSGIQGVCISPFIYCPYCGKKIEKVSDIGGGK